jgi:hypothetical protein
VRGRESGEGEVGGDVEPIRAAVGMGAGSGEKVGWTEGVVEGEDSEW